MRRSNLFRSLLALLLLLVAVPAAWAQSCSGGQVSLSIPNAYVPKSATVGTLIGSPVNATATFSCSGLPSSGKRFAIQIFNLKASQLYPATLPSANSTNITSLTFATNVPGIGVQLTMSPAMRGYDVNPGDQQSGAYVIGYITGTSGSVSVNYTAQLVVTGTVGAGTISKTTLLNYEWYIYGVNNSASLGTTFDITAGTVVAQPSCSVDPSYTNFAVQLPPITAQSLPTKGSTTGDTGFGILLNCTPGAAVTIRFDPQTGNNNGLPAGTLPTSTGGNYASNVLIQLLKSDDSTIMPISQAVPLTGFTTPNGPLTLQFYARYYSNAGSVGSGDVKGVATFTLTYN